MEVRRVAEGLRGFLSGEDILPLEEEATEGVLDNLAPVLAVFSGESVRICSVALPKYSMEPKHTAGKSRKREGALVSKSYIYIQGKTKRLEQPISQSEILHMSKCDTKMRGEKGEKSKRTWDDISACISSCQRSLWLSCRPILLANVPYRLR